MELLVDECVFKTTVNFLRSNAHDVLTVGECDLLGSEDKLILDKVVGLNRTLLTADKDFSDIILYPPSIYHGIIVLKITKAIEKDIHTILLKLLKENEVSVIRQSLCIVDKNKYRIRHNI